MKQYRLETDFQFGYNRHYIYENGEWGTTLKIIIHGDIDLAERIEYFLNNPNGKKYEAAR
jgi:hypothetical protein